MKQIRAAGTVTVDTSGNKPKILMVHRPGYDDWTIPKGKIRFNEFAAVAAHRETQEETGARVRLDIPVNTITYPVGGGRKTVHYWRADPIAVKKRKPNREVDKVVWLSPKNALKRLTYDDEQELVEQALSLPQTTTVALVRHGKAMERKNWSGRDQARPVSAQGRRQAKDLVPLLAAYGIETLVSSTSTRCMQTLVPYEREIRGEIEGWAALSEEQAEIDEQSSAKVMRRITKRAIAGQHPTAVCGHRPVLPIMFQQLGVSPKSLQPGALGIVHLSDTGEALGVEWVRPRR